MDALFFTHLMVSTALVGLIWTVQLVHYPAKLFVEAERFAEYEVFHQRRISIVVVPLMLTELLSGLALCAWYLQDGNLPWQLSVSMVMLLGIWASTFFIQVPLHNRIASGKDPEAISKLVRSNWLRTILWTMRALLLLSLALTL